MKPAIRTASQISSGQSVVCILGSDSIPGRLGLGDSEKEYALTQLSAKAEYVFINSYDHVTFLVRTKENPEHHRVREEVRRAACSIRMLLKEHDLKELVVTSEDTYPEAVLDYAEGMILGIYSFEKYKTADAKEKKKKYPETIILHTDIGERDIEWLRNLTDSVWFARDLINEPVNHLNTLSLAGEIQKAGESYGFMVEVLNKGKIEALKMGGLLAVNKGSVDPPVFCILEWNPPGKVNSKPVVLVGKGVVYDTGGLNIKTGEHMSGMHEDMAGAAIVTGVMCAIARSRIPLHVVGLIPSTDNRPGGNAYTQGDIITMYNKMTVEIGNTDAEGRLILADAISYAAKYNPQLIIDIATLTGSAAMTFSNQAIAVMSNAERNYVELLHECGRDVYERIAELPLWDEYGEMIKSDVADIRNVGGREAGAITAGKFLEKFAGSPLIHLDIAGTEILKKDDFYRIKKGPATGLRLLATFLKRYAAQLNDMK